MEVDAIEDGKIVRVSEEYSRIEGLMIIKKKIDSTNPPEVRAVPLVQLRRAERRAKPQIEEFRKPLNYKKNDVLSELKENFQWEISRKRREKNLSRKQLAFMIGENEDVIISLENGFLPQDNFILLNKVENALGISLRKDKKESVLVYPISKPAQVPVEQVVKHKYEIKPAEKKKEIDAEEALELDESEEVIDLTGSKTDLD